MPDIVDTLSRATAADIAFLDSQRKWHDLARHNQILPLDGWSTTLALAGRGFGKTRVGAEWCLRQAGLYPGIMIHVVAPTYSDLRGVVFEGNSGLVAVVPKACVRSLTYSPYPEMILWNGSIIRGFSADTPNRLRGPQASMVWGDELAAWYHAEECLNNIDFSTRIAYRHVNGRLIQPQKLYTTTPRPMQLLVKMIEKKLPNGDPATVLIRGSTLDNRANLAENFFTDLLQYEGTQIGRQEIYGELLDLAESAIIKKSWLNVWPSDVQLPWWEFIMVSMDTAFTEKTYDRKTFSSDPTACTTWGAFLHEPVKGKGATWNLILMDCWEKWLGFPDLITEARKMMQETRFKRRTKPIFEPLVGPVFAQDEIKKADLLIIEDKGSGISLRQMLSKEGLDSFPYNPGRADKLSRLHSVSHIARHGRIWVPETADRRTRTTDLSGKTVMKPTTWAEPLLSQLCSYSGPGTTPHDDWVDSCIVSATIIRMGDGTSRCVSEVRAGEMVDTPIGPRRVLQAGVTGIKSIWRLEWNGGQLEGTGNHPVWADDTWCRLDSLSQGSIMRTWPFQKNPAFESKLSSSMVIDTTDILTHRVLRIGVTLVALAIVFTAMCGNIIRGLFQKAMTSIIMTMILATTIYPIFVVCPRKNTSRAIGKPMLEEGAGRNNLSIWPELTVKRLRGIVVPKAVSGIVSTLRRAFVKRGLQSLFPDSRSTDVNVSGAINHTGRSSTAPSSVVRVVRVKNLGIDAKVYNLRVEEAECYYANGILVHNCTQAWRVFADRFVADGVTKRIGVDDAMIQVMLPENNPEFEYSYDIESGRATPRHVVAPYD